MNYFHVAVLCFSTLALLWQQKVTHQVLDFALKDGSGPEGRTETLGAGTSFDGCEEPLWSRLAGKIQAPISS